MLLTFGPTLYSSYLCPWWMPFQNHSHPNPACTPHTMVEFFVEKGGRTRWILDMHGMRLAMQRWCMQFGVYITFSFLYFSAAVRIMHSPPPVLKSPNRLAGILVISFWSCLSPLYPNTARRHVKHFSCGSPLGHVENGSDHVQSSCPCSSMAAV